MRVCVWWEHEGSVCEHGCECMCVKWEHESV